MSATSSSVEKLSKSRPDNIYLITQEGEDDIGSYSIILSVPPEKHAAFLKAHGNETFHAEDYGNILHYSAGELSLADCRKWIKGSSS